MMTIDEYIEIPCPKCDKPVGKACGRWEGMPGICPERARAAEKAAKLRKMGAAVCK